MWEITTPGPTLNRRTPPRVSNCIPVRAHQVAKSLDIVDAEVAKTTEPWIFPWRGFLEGKKIWTTPKKTGVTSLVKPQVNTETVPFAVFFFGGGEGMVVPDLFWKKFQG